MSDSMSPLDMMTDEEIIGVLQDRMRAKGLCYLFAHGFDDGERYFIVSELDYEHLQEIYENEMEEFTSYLYNTSNWEPTDEELLQWEADFEEEDEDETEDFP